MAYTPGDWLDGRQFDEDGRAIAFDPTQLNTINGVKQQASFGPYFQKLLDSGVISKDRMLTGSDNYGGAGQQWFPGNDGNIYLVDGSGKRPITRIPASNIDPATGKDKVGSISEFLDPKTGAVTGTGKADFDKMDPGSMVALAMIAAMTGGAALAGMGVIGGGAAAGGAGGAAGGGGAAAGSSGFGLTGSLGSIGTQGLGFTGLTSATLPAAGATWGGTALAGAGAAGVGGALAGEGLAGGGTSVMGAGAEGMGSSVFNPAMDSQLANTQLGITGSEAAGDAAATGIPSVTVNGAPLTSEAVQSAIASTGLTPAQVASNPSLLQQVASTLGVTPGMLTSLIGPAVSAIGGALSANATKDAANSAANAQMQAAQSGIDEWRRQFDTVRGLLNPYVQAGTQAVGAQGDLAGINGADKQQAAITNLQTMPAFTSQLKLGENRILQNASATGGLRGGNTQGAMAYFAPQLLAQTINDQYSRLGGLTSIGANAAAGVGNAGMTTTQGVTGLQQQGGAAQAGAAIAGGAAQQRLYGGLSTAFGQFFGYGGGVPGMSGTTAAPPAAAGVPPNPFL